MRTVLGEIRLPDLAQVSVLVDLEPGFACLLDHAGLPCDQTSAPHAPEHTTPAERRAAMSLERSA